MDPLVALGIGIAALVASIAGGIAGIGTAIAMVPILTLAFGVREAIPIISVATLFNNASRIWFNRDVLDYRAAGWFSLGAVPSAALGSVAFANAPAEGLVWMLGAFLIAIVISRHVPFGRKTHVGARTLGLVGLVHGFASSLFGGAGPLGAPFFLAYGLTRAAFVGTLALGTMALNLSRVGVFTGYGFLTERVLLIGLGVGLVMFVGPYIGSRVVRRVPERIFPVLVEAIIVIAALLLIVKR